MHHCLCPARVPTVYSFCLIPLWQPEHKAHHLPIRAPPDFPYVSRMSPLPGQRTGPSMLLSCWSVETPCPQSPPRRVCYSRNPPRPRRRRHLYLPLLSGRSQQTIPRPREPTEQPPTGDCERESEWRAPLSPSHGTITPTTRSGNEPATGASTTERSGAVAVIVFGIATTTASRHRLERGHSRRNNSLLL